jgi:hypothetical protein
MTEPSTELTAVHEVLDVIDHEPERVRVGESASYHRKEIAQERDRSPRQPVSPEPGRVPAAR